MRTAKRILKIAWRVLLGLILLVVLYSLVIKPLARGLRLRHRLLAAIDNASSVKVVEHSDRWDHHTFDPDYKQVTYAKVTLSPDQIQSLRSSLSPRLDISGDVMTKCIFEEHHYIEMTERDGSVVTLHLCFHCGEIEVNNENQRIMPWGWYSSLSGFITSIGLHPEGPWDTNPDATK